MYVHKSMVEGQLKRKATSFIEAEKELLRGVIGIMDHSGVVRYTDDAFMLEFGLCTMRLVIQP